jgi:hypothetical protein
MPTEICQNSGPCFKKPKADREPVLYGNGLKRHKPLKRNSKPIARHTPLPRATKFIRAEGTRGRARRKWRVLVKMNYLDQHGNGRLAPCQICGTPHDLTGVAAHHKVKRSLGGKDTPENAVALCHDCHTEGPKAIHKDGNQYLLALVAENPANMANGRRISLVGLA